MNKLIVTLFVVFTLAMLAVLGITIWGYTLPEEIRFSHNRTVKTKPEAVHALLMDPAKITNWKGGVDRITKGRPQLLIDTYKELADKDEILKAEGRYRPRLMPEKAIYEWAEWYKTGELRAMGLVFKKDKSVYHHTMQDTTLPYRRRWYFFIKPAGEGKVILEIQEENKNRNAFFRVWNRKFGDPISEIRSWMDGLVRELENK